MSIEDFFFYMYFVFFDNLHLKLQFGYVLVKYSI